MFCLILGFLNEYATILFKKTIRYLEVKVRKFCAVTVRARTDLRVQESGHRTRARLCDESGDTIFLQRQKTE